MEKIWINDNNEYFLDDDDITNEITGAFGGANTNKKMKTSEPLNNTAPPISRPVTVIQEINDAFNDDPMSAIIDSLAPYHRPSDIRKEFNNGEINKLVAWRQKADDKANAMWNDKEHVFITMVNGFLLQKSSVSQGGNVKNMTSRDRESIPIQLSHRQAVVLGANEVSVNPNGYTNVAAPPDLSNKAGAAKATETTQMLSKTGFDIAGIGNVGATAAQQEAKKQEELNYLKRLEQVSNVIDTTATSGQEEMTNDMLMAVGSSLSTLSREDRKFLGAKRQQFYNDETAMTLFAQLVGSEISMRRYTNPDRYYKDLNIKEMKENIKRISMQMRQELCWSAKKNCFVVATQQDIIENRKRRAEELRNAIRGINT